MKPNKLEQLHNVLDEPQPQKDKLTAPDLRLKQFLKLQQGIKQLTKELNTIKEEIKHQGSYSTMNYIASVTTTQTTSAPKKEVFVSKYGPSVLSLWIAGTRTVVSVSKKDGRGWAQLVRLVRTERRQQPELFRRE